MSVLLMKDKLKRERARGLLEAWSFCDAFLAGASKSTEPVHDNQLRVEAVKVVRDSIEDRIGDLSGSPCPICKGAGNYWAPGDYAPSENFYCDCVKGRRLAKNDAARAAAEAEEPKSNMHKDGDHDDAAHGPAEECPDCMHHNST